MKATITDLIRDIQRGREIDYEELDNLSDDEIDSLLKLSKEYKRRVTKIDDEILSRVGYIVTEKVLKTGTIELLSYLLKDIDMQIEYFSSFIKSEIVYPELATNWYKKNLEKYTAFYKEAESIFIEMKKKIKEAKALEEKFMEIDEYFNDHENNNLN